MHSNSVGEVMGVLYVPWPTIPANLPVPSEYRHFPSITVPSWFVLTLPSNEPQNGKLLISDTTSTLCHVSCALTRRRTIPLSACEIRMPRKTCTETPIERIHREVTGDKMPAVVKSILLPKPKTRRQLMDSPLGQLIMSGDEWIQTLADGRRVKFTNQELQDECVFITAQIERNKVVYSIVLTKARNPLSRGEVESHFEGELSKKSLKPN